jgi:hypothetical protein
MLRKYVRQLRPLQENKLRVEEKIRFLTESDTEQDLVEKTISVEYNKLKGSTDPIKDALLNSAEYSKIKPELVEQGKRVAQQLHKNHSQIGILKHLGRGNATNQYGKLYGLNANDTTPKTDIGDGAAYNLSLKEAAGAQLMSPKGEESTGLVQSAVDRYTAAGGKVDATKALSLLNEELDNLAVKEMVLTVGGGKIEGAKDAFQNWYFNKSERRNEIAKVEKNKKKQDDHMKAELSVHKITKTDRKYKYKLIKGISPLSQNDLRNKYFKNFIGSEYSVKGYVIPDKYLKTDNDKELVKNNKKLQEKVVEILDVAIKQKEFLSSLANEFTKNNEFAKYVIYEAASGHAKFTGDVKSSPPYTGNENAVAKKIMTYDKNTGAVELEDIWDWSKKSGGLLVDNLNIDFKSSRTSRAGYTKFAVGIGKKVIPLMNDYQIGFYNESMVNNYETFQNIIEEEYLKIYPILNNVIKDLQKLDEGILDFVKKGFASTKDFVVGIGKKIRDIFIKFLKAVFDRFVTMIKELFETDPNKALETLGVEYVVSGVRIYK